MLLWFLLILWENNPSLQLFIVHLCFIQGIRHKTSKPLTLRQGLWLVLSHGPYIRLVIGVLFTSLAFMVRKWAFFFPFLWASWDEAVFVVISSDLLDTKNESFSLASGRKLCYFHHLHAQTQERLPESSPGCYGECLHLSCINALIGLNCTWH